MYFAEGFRFMKEWHEKFAKAWMLADAIFTGIVFVLALLVLIARAIYLAWR
jgi:hypothetical protein